MRSSRVVFPIFESIHLIGLALFVGTLLLTDLGCLASRCAASRFIKSPPRSRPGPGRGFALLMLTGPFMFTAQAAKWHDNPVFWIKMLLLTIATIFQLSVRRKISPTHLVPAKLIGAVSLILWISIGTVVQDDGVRMIPLSDPSPNFGWWASPSILIFRNVPAPFLAKNGSAGFSSQRFQPVTVCDSFASSFSAP